MITAIQAIESKTFTIDDIYCGPPGIGNGGYMAGRLAQHIAMNDQAVQVTLHRPTFIRQPLNCMITPSDTAVLYDGRVKTAEAAVARLELDVPPPPSLRQAAVARLSYRAQHHHPFPNCFVCGTNRQPGDGLRIFAGPTGCNDLYAAPWKPYQVLTDSRGYVKPEFVWAALDCPGAFAAMGNHVRPLLLGRLTAQIYTPLMVENDYVVTSWLIAQEGCKHHVGTAVFTSNGSLQAKAKAIWFDIK